MRSSKTGLIVLIVSLIVIVATFGVWRSSVAQARPPAQDVVPGITIPYQGRLTDDAGHAVPDGVYAFTFSLYDTDRDGTLLWSEVQEALPVQTGAFSAALGRVNPLPAAAGQGGEYWLEVAVRGPDESDFTVLNPRQRVSAVGGTAAGTLAGAPCPHDHLYEEWVGSSTSYALRVENTSITTGDGIRSYTRANNSDYASFYGVNSGSGTAVYGHSTLGVGVRGSSDGMSAILGEASAAYTSGVYGINSAALGYGVTGSNDNFFGVRADGNDASAFDSLGDLLLGGDHGEIFAEGDRLGLYSNGWVVVELDNDNDGWACFDIWGGDDSLLWTVCETAGVRTTQPAGTVAQTAEYGSRTLFAVGSPEVWVEDFGTATLVNGRAVVTIEPVFAQTVNLEEYHVFLTPLGDCGGLYVAAKSATSFEVRELGGGTASVSFDYRIVARQLGYEDTRLEEFSGTEGRP